MARKPVIFIPGFPASELHDANSGATVYPPSITTLLDPAKKQRFLREVTTVPGNLIAGPPIASVVGGIVSEAQSIYNIMRDQYGYDVSGSRTDFIPIGWDWRLSISADDTVGRIARALDQLSPAKDGNVVAILHSTGGLVFRAFLEKRPEYARCFEQMLTFGVPWGGTLEAMQAMTLGESIGFLFVKLSASESASMISRAQAAYDLLPSDPRTDLSWIPAGLQHNFMRALAATAHSLFSRDFDTLPVTNVCGWGAPTWTGYTVAQGHLSFNRSPDKLGDGTVPVVSSSSLQGTKVRSMFLPIGAYATNFLPQYHGQIWNSPPVLQLFDEVLLDRVRMPFICAAADSDDYLDLNRDVRVRLSASAADDSPLPNCTANVNLDGNSVVVPFRSDTRAVVIVNRAGIHHNIEPDLYRFAIDFQWDGGSAERVVLIRSV